MKVKVKSVLFEMLTSSKFITTWPEGQKKFQRLCQNGGDAILSFFHFSTLFIFQIFWTRLLSAKFNLKNPFVWDSSVVFTDNFNYCVVYFDQRLGALHPKGWSKYAFIDLQIHLSHQANHWLALVAPKTVIGQEEDLSKVMWGP